MPSPAAAAMPPATERGAPRLRANALGFFPTLAQSIALISPTMTAVLIIPLAFTDAGRGTWAAYLFGTIMLLFVVGGLNQFAKRSASAGSMYAYTGRGLGPVGGVLSGWTLLWSYFFIGVAGLAGFAISAQNFLGAIGVGTVTPILFFIISAGICAAVAWLDIRLSSVLMLVFEALSVTFILGLAAVVIFHPHVNAIDTSQLTLKGVSIKGIDFAVVVCIFSLVGFESATTLGGEARNPTKNVPRAVVWSLIVTGLFMVVMAYIEVLATHDHASFGSLTAPLSTISVLYGVSWFKIPIWLGATVSFFSLTLSCLNASARIMLPMSDHGIFPKQIRAVHHKHMTPHAAIGTIMSMMFAFAVILYATSDNANTIFGDAGTLAAFGFLLAYFMISVAAPVYLRKLGELRGRNVAIATLAFVCLMVPTVGSFYPAPSYPINLFPYIFLGYMLIGGAWMYVVHRTRPATMGEIEVELETSIAAHREAGEPRERRPTFEGVPQPVEA
ncbi:MAG: APC family permease [Solirubrobacteraceae bacterium]|jgi:amino acid transporter